MGCFWARIFANSNCPQVFLLSRQVSQLVVDYQQSENIAIFRWQLYRTAVTTIPASRWWRRRPRLCCRERSFTQWGHSSWSMTGGCSGDSGTCHWLFIGLVIHGYFWLTTISLPLFLNSLFHFLSFLQLLHINQSELLTHIKCWDKFFISRWIGLGNVVHL